MTYAVVLLTSIYSALLINFKNKTFEYAIHIFTLELAKENKDDFDPRRPTYGQHYIFTDEYDGRLHLSSSRE